MSLLLLFGSKETPLEASVAATSSATGTLVVTRALAGNAAGAATAGATLNATVALTGTAAGVSAASADLLAVRLLEGTVSGSSSCTGDMNALVLLEGTSAGQSGITGSLRYSGLSLSDVYLEVTGTPVFNNDANPADNYLGSWTLPCTVRSGGKADCILETGMAAVKWGHHNQTGETDPYTGGLLMTSDLNTAPYLDVFTVDSGDSPYPWETSALTPRVRLGNLNGVGGLSSDEWGIALGTDLSDNTSAAKSLIASDQRFAMRNIDISLWKSGKQTISIEADGDVKFGTDISSPATTSFTFDASTGTVSLTGYMANGSALPWGDITGLPSPLGTVGNAGLYLTSSYMGYWNGEDAWNAYIKSDGTFRFGGGAEYLDFDGTNLSMSGAGGAISLTSGGLIVTPGTNGYNKLQWATGGVTYGAIHTFYTGGGSYMEIACSKATPKNAIADISIKPIGDSSSAELKLTADAVGGSQIDFKVLDVSMATFKYAKAVFHYAVNCESGLSCGADPTIKSATGLAGHIEAHGASDTVGVFYGLNRTYLAANAYYDGGWKYATSAAAAILECNQYAGVMGYYSKASGTKGNAIGTWDTNFTVNTSGDGTFRGKFGCNGKTAQAAYALNSAVSGTVDDSYGAEEHAVLDALVAQVNKLRAALVANGICS